MGLSRLRVCPIAVCLSGERLCVYGAEFGSGRKELLEIIAGITYPTDGFSSVLMYDSKNILRGMTFGFGDDARDRIHGTSRPV